MEAVEILDGVCKQVLTVRVDISAIDTAMTVCNEPELPIAQPDPHGLLHQCSACGYPSGSEFGSPFVGGHNGL